MAISYRSTLNWPNIFYLSDQKLVNWPVFGQEMATTWRLLIWNVKMGDIKCLWPVFNRSTLKWPNIFYLSDQNFWNGQFLAKQWPELVGRLVWNVEMGHIKCFIALFNRFTLNWPNISYLSDQKLVKWLVFGQEMARTYWLI